MKHHPTTPLMKAVKQGSFAQVAALIEVRASVDDIDKHGDTALHLCAATAAGTLAAVYSIKIATLLMKAGANPYVRNLEGQSVIDLCDSKALQDFIIATYERLHNPTLQQEAAVMHIPDASKTIITEESLHQHTHKHAHSASEIQAPNPKKAEKVVFLSQ